MYPFKTVITTVKMAKSKLHPTFIRAHVYPGTAGTCNFYPAPRKWGKGTSTIIAPHTRSGERHESCSSDWVSPENGAYSACNMCWQEQDASYSVKSALRWGKPDYSFSNYIANIETQFVGGDIVCVIYVVSQFSAGPWWVIDFTFWSFWLLLSALIATIAAVMKCINTGDNLNN